MRDEDTAPVTALFVLLEPAGGRPAGTLFRMRPDQADAPPWAGLVRPASATDAALAAATLIDFSASPPDAE